MNEDDRIKEIREKAKEAAKELLEKIPEDIQEEMRKEKTLGNPENLKGTDEEE